MYSTQREPAVFIVNSDESSRTWIEAMVVAAGLDAISFATAAELSSHLNFNTATCVILDVVLRDANGLELQDKLARAGAAVMFLTREHCILSCVKALKAGAVDFLTMPCDAKQLVCALRHAVSEALATWTHRAQADELRSRYEQLTSREREIFSLVASGLRNKQIAQELDIREITVQIHRGRVMKKMRARSLASLVRMADAVQAELSPAAHRTPWQRESQWHPSTGATGNRTVPGAAL